MSVKLKLNLPRSVWSAKDTKTVALNTVATVKRRTMKGLSSNGGKFKKYSTKPMYVAFKGARLKPKGGTRVSRPFIMMAVISNIRMIRGSDPEDKGRRLKLILCSVVNS